MAAILFFKMAANPTNSWYIGLSQTRMFAELRAWGYTHVFWPENRLEQLFVWDR